MEKRVFIAMNLVKLLCGLDKEMKTGCDVLALKYCDSNQKVMVQAAADCWNRGPRRAAFGNRLLLFLNINMK